MSRTIILSSEYRRDQAKRYVDAAPPDAVVKISEARRSSSQNDMMWQILTDISVAKPLGRRHTPEVWKAILMNACGHQVQFEMGIDGQPFPIGFRSSRMTKQQMSEFLDYLLWFCAEHDILTKEAAVEPNKRAVNS